MTCAAASSKRERAYAHYRFYVWQRTSVAQRLAWLRRVLRHAQPFLVRMLFNRLTYDFPPDMIVPLPVEGVPPAIYDSTTEILANLSDAEMAKHWEWIHQLGMVEDKVAAALRSCVDTPASPAPPLSPLCINTESLANRLAKARAVGNFLQTQDMPGKVITGVAEGSKFFTVACLPREPRVVRPDTRARDLPAGVALLQDAGVETTHAGTSRLLGVRRDGSVVAIYCSVYPRKDKRYAYFAVVPAETQCMDIHEMTEAREIVPDTDVHLLCPNCVGFPKI